MVKAVLPTPPSPNTTSLYKAIFPAMVKTFRGWLLAVKASNCSYEWNRRPGPMINVIMQNRIQGSIACGCNVVQKVLMNFVGESPWDVPWFDNKAMVQRCTKPI
jgi:hypothetical protein